jgi:hypothetical protein
MDLAHRSLAPDVAASAAGVPNCNPPHQAPLPTPADPMQVLYRKNVATPGFRIVGIAKSWRAPRAAGTVDSERTAGTSPQEMNRDAVSASR